MQVRFRRWLAGELGVGFWQIPLAEIAVRRFLIIGYAFQPHLLDHAVLMGAVMPLPVARWSWTTICPILTETIGTHGSKGRRCRVPGRLAATGASRAMGLSWNCARARLRLTHWHKRPPCRFASANTLLERSCARNLCHRHMHPLQERNRTDAGHSGIP